MLTYEQDGLIYRCYLDGNICQLITCREGRKPEVFCSISPDQNRAICLAVAKAFGISPQKVADPIFSRRANCNYLVSILVEGKEITGEAKISPNEKLGAIVSAFANVQRKFVRRSV